MESRHAIASRQKGIVMVEFAIIGLLFFIILFSVFEFSRLLFVWNAVADATRLGARAAAVCVIDSDDIVNIARSDPSGSPFLPNNITADNIQVRYLDINGNQTFPNPADIASYVQTRYVEVSIVDYWHELLIPMVGGMVKMPGFTATRPREALGIIPIMDGSGANAGNQGC